MENLVLVGFALVFIGILVIVIGSVISGKTETKWGVGGFVGFLPFGFANDPKMLWIVIGISIAVLVIFILLNFKLF